MNRERYLKSRALAGDWFLEGCVKGGFAGAVIIPSLAESTTLQATLSSLAACAEAELRRFLVVVVVNNRSDASLFDKQDNQTTLEQLSCYDVPLNLAWIDAASPGRELPLKGGGVGMARKLGADLALQCLEYGDNDPLLVYLDADTLVRPDYLSAITAHFASHRQGGATIPFIHQPATTVAGQRAIDRYELFLRSYVLGLSWAGSPYGFHTVGSAMACRISSYLKIGGMNCRQAGEDFYFLQQLSRVDGMSQLSGTIVYPSPRASHRVPFGTGRAVSRALNDDIQSFLFYHFSCYCILEKWLSLVRSHCAADAAPIMEAASSISPLLRAFLEDHQFRDVWHKLHRHHPEQDRLIKAFHDWFDGLKTMKLIHHLSSDGFPRCGAEIALPALFAAAGIAVEPDIAKQLAALRALQI